MKISSALKSALQPLGKLDITIARENTTRHSLCRQSLVLYSFRKFQWSEGFWMCKAMPSQATSLVPGKTIRRSLVAVADAGSCITASMLL